MSRRDAESENFPVASRLLPAWSRPHVRAFYEFARAADDVADSPAFTALEKTEILKLWSKQLVSGEGEVCRPVSGLRASLQVTGVTDRHAQDLLKAFLRDAENRPMESWDDLMGYCALSAAPVGRYLIDLFHGNSTDLDALYPPSDALCAALQVLNHIQDGRDDYERLGRVYVPADWMAEAGVAPDHMGRHGASRELRIVLDRMLDGVDALLFAAKPLPGLVTANALAREAGGILAIAWRLDRALRRKDPLATRVVLAKPQAAFWFLWGALMA